MAFIPVKSFLPIIVFFFSIPAFSAQEWFPFPVEIHSYVGSETIQNYTPIKKASRPWDLCVSFPHMKDSYWLAVNFGVAEEVRRLGVQMHLYKAGGYDDLAKQRQQLKQCIENGSDGVIIGAISYEGLSDLVEEMVNQEIPVIDLVNGISSEHVHARSLVSFEEMGYQAGSYIVSNHSETTKPVNVAWFPGPADAGWVMAGDKGFKAAVSDSVVNIVTSRYGDTGKKTQETLLLDVLNKHPDLDYIIGNAVTAAAAVKVIRSKGLSNEIKIFSYYFTPEVYRGIKRGQILGAPTDSAVIQGRIAVDQVVRILDGEPYLKDVGPKIYVIDKHNIHTFDKATSLAPSGFRATYSVGVPRFSN
ncbi:MAG: TMAO reductase system periplasmic protein TorT [Neptuniibacter sp.]